MVRCPECGYQMSWNAKRCYGCGWTKPSSNTTMMSEDEIRGLLRYYQGCPIDEIETWKETKEYMLGYVVGLLKRVLGEGIGEE